MTHANDLNAQHIVFNSVYDTIIANTEAIGMSRAFQRDNALGKGIRGKCLNGGNNARNLIAR